MNWNLSVLSPDRVSAKISAQGPGILSTFRLSLIQCFTSLSPGSAIVGVPASDIRTTFNPSFSFSVMISSLFCSLNLW